MVIKMKTIDLICNAHLDPVWLWEWEEGAAEAISTFRVAADFCEEYEGFVFNHNEVVLYQWVEEYEPQLFKRIQHLVKEGKWHIMGGWYLQPDCNMPTGESFIRHIIEGREYFKQKFGKVPTTAINFDSFGHTRGLVQILKKSGYDSYVICRPKGTDCILPSDDFVWVGYDGSEITVRRAQEHYNSTRGEAKEKIEKWIENNQDKECGMILWGIGNHGGGPSKVDLTRINEYIAENTEYKIKHSTPEEYFSKLAGSYHTLPKYTGDLNAWAVGCYTSQILIKQKHRELENQYYMTEKMCATLSLQDLLPYPHDELKESRKDLMFSQFHDILPGSSIEPVEKMALRMMDHGLEILSKVRARAFFALTSGQKKAEDGEYPIFVYNPHPYVIDSTISCEFQLADQNYSGDFSIPVMTSDGVEIASQIEKEASSLPIDWRKNVVFQAKLQPGSVNRFDMKMKRVPQKSTPLLAEKDGYFTFASKEMTVKINCSTGLVDKYTVDGVDYLDSQSFLPLVLKDDEDPWAMRVDSFKEVIGQFSLMDDVNGTEYSGVTQGTIKSVRVIEEGSVRTVIEAVMQYGYSFMCVHYKLPHTGSEIEVDIRVNWNEKDKILKLSIPTVMKQGKYFGQVAYGVENLPTEGKEVVSQKWSGVFDENNNKALTVVNNGIYGSDYHNGEIRLSLLRSPGYAAHPIEERVILPQDRFCARSDQGEHRYKFWIKAGKPTERWNTIERESLIHNEQPYKLSFYPSGEGKTVLPSVLLDDDVVQMTAFYQKNNEGLYAMRLYEPTGNSRESVVNIPLLGIQKTISFAPFEIKTYVIDKRSKTITETEIL